MENLGIWRFIRKIIVINHVICHFIITLHTIEMFNYIVQNIGHQQTQTELNFNEFIFHINVSINSGRLMHLFVLQEFNKHLRIPNWYSIICVRCILYSLNRFHNYVIYFIYFVCHVCELIRWIKINLLGEWRALINIKFQYIK